MPYEYQKERPGLFTETGMALFISLRGQVRTKCKVSGCVRFDKLSISGDSWTALACMDLMIEREEVRRVTNGQERAAQYHVYELVGDE